MRKNCSGIIPSGGSSGIPCRQQTRRKSREAAKEKINVTNLTAKVGFKVSGELKDRAIAELENDKN